MRPNCPNNSNLHEIPICPGPTFQSIQDKVDEYARNTSEIFEGYEIEVDSKITNTLRLGLEIQDYCRRKLDELDFYKMKYTDVPPEDLEMSNLRNCFIGRCRCGQMLIQDKDRCCPKCKQFIKWPKRPLGEAKVDC